MTREAVTQTQAPTSHPLTSGGILQRQCVGCGQHAIAAGECETCTKKKRGLQRKLAIGSSHDPLEREADRVAAQVMAAPAHPAVGHTLPRIQRYSGPIIEGSDTAPASVDRVLASPGRPLEPALQQDMGQRFGYDFSQVRVHTGAAAARSAQEVDASAYTVGRNIAFNAGRFRPSTPEGKRLLAHELAHVVQQSGTQISPTSQSIRTTRLPPISYSNEGVILRRQSLRERATQLVERVERAIDPRTRQFISDLIASVRESPQHVGEFITGDLWESIRQHWPSILGVTLGLLAIQGVIGALGVAPTGVTQIIAAILEVIVLAVLGYFVGVELVGVAEEGIRWWTAAREANGDAQKISDASRAFVRMVWHILMAVLVLTGVRARVRGGAVSRVRAPFQEPPPPRPQYGIRRGSIQGGDPNPVRIERGRVVSTPRSAPRTGSSGPVATAGESAARAFAPDPIPDVPAPARPVPELVPPIAPGTGSASGSIRPGVQPIPAAATGVSSATRSRPEIPPNLSPEEQAFRRRCIEMHDTYHATQTSLGLRSSQIANLSDNFRNSRATAQQILDLCSLVDEQIRIAQRLHRQRLNYVDEGCDRVDWFSRGTTEAQRRQVHIDELAQVHQQLRNLYRLRRDLNCS